MSSPVRALTIRAKGGLLRVLASDVVVMAPFLGEPSLQPQPIQQGQFKGIWDTGASGSVITKSVVDTIQLKPTGQKQVNAANGSYIANTYLVNIVLPGDIHVQHVQVTEGQLGGIDLLIGMDIISLGDFSITNVAGNTVMSFRTPSCNEVDFVQRVQEKVRSNGRNRGKKRR